MLDKLKSYGKITSFLGPTHISDHFEYHILMGGFFFGHLLPNIDARGSLTSSQFSLLCRHGRYGRLLSTLFCAWTSIGWGCSHCGHCGREDGGTGERPEGENCAG